MTKTIFLATFKTYLAIMLNSHLIYSMENTKSQYTDEQIKIYLKKPETSLSLKLDWRFSSIEEKGTQAIVEFVRESIMETRYEDHKKILRGIFTDYAQQPFRLDNPRILVIGAGMAHEVRVLRDLNKNVRLIVEPEKENLEIARSMGNIVNEQCYEGLVENLTPDWNEKFDIAIWQYFVAGYDDKSDFETTLKSIYCLLKPNGIFYPASDSHMLSFIHKHEASNVLYSKTAIPPLNFEESFSFGIFRLAKKQPNDY